MPLLAVLAGCSEESREKYLPMFFDGTDARPPVRRVRRDLLREIDTLKGQLAEAEAKQTTVIAGGPVRPGNLAIERAKTWEEAVKLLPKTDDGEVDWSKALKTGVIYPQPGPDPGAQPEAMLDFNVIRIPPDVSNGEGCGVCHGTVAFPATACARCHPAMGG